MPAQTLGVKRRLILDAPGDSEPSSAVMLGVSPAPRGPGRAAYRGGSSRTPCSSRKAHAITARLLEVDRPTPGAGVTPSVAAEEGSESPGASSIRRRLTPRVCAGILNPAADFS